MRIALLLLLAFLPLQEERSKTTVAFEVDCARALEGSVRVSMTVNNVTGKEIELAMPVWAPGSYRIQNFQKNVSNVASKQKLEEVDDKTWKIAAGGAESVTVNYDVKVSPGNVGDTWYDCIGPATFMYVVGQKDAPQSCVFKMPKGWNAINGLEKRDGAFVARDYDTFIDQPTMLGYFEVLEFTEMGALYQVACCGPVRGSNDFGIAFAAGGTTVKTTTANGPAAKAGLKEGDVIKKANNVEVASVKDLGKQAWSLFREEKIDLEIERGGKAQSVTLALPARVDGKKLADCHQKLVRPSVKMFGGKAPFDRYVFLIYFSSNPGGGGGLEHLFSCHINYSLPAVVRDPYNIASLESHEFFHAWNVKRIRPFELGPFDYTKPVPSKHLWLCEGVTSYYGDLALARCKLWDEARYFQHVGLTIGQVQSEPERLARSIEDYCEAAQWGAKPQTWYYYAKGEVIGLLLDLKIRAMTENKKSFDDVMRHLYKTYVTDPAEKGKGWIGTGFPRDGILKALNDATGKDFKDFYDRYISGSEELPYKEVFAAAGLAYAANERVVGLNVSVSRNLTVDAVAAGSDVEKAGFQKGDKIVALNGTKVDSRGWRDAVAKLDASAEVKVTVDRDGKEMALKAKPRTGMGNVSVKRGDKMTELQKRIVDSWLGQEEY